MIYQIPVDQITGLAKYGLALSCTAVSDLAESDLARYAPPSLYLTDLFPTPLFGRTPSHTFLLGLWWATRTNDSPGQEHHSSNHSSPLSLSLLSVCLSPAPRAKCELSP